MPRIRYLKDKDWDFKLYEEEEESPSGNSWLSNANMAALLSDAKIKQTISALKAQITVLEAELLSRRFGNRNQNDRDWDKIGNLRGPEDGERLYPKISRKSSKRTNATCYQFQKVASLRRTLAKLGVKDVDSLLAEWSKITNETK